MIQDDGIELDEHRAVETFSEWKTRKLAAFATFPACSLPEDDAATREQMLRETAFSAYPIVNAQGQLTGVASRGELEAGETTTHEPGMAFLDTTIEETERLLVEAPLGLVVVTDKERRPLGVFTLHDLLRCQLALMDAQ